MKRLLTTSAARTLLLIASCIGILVLTDGRAVDADEPERSPISAAASEPTRTAAVGR